MKKQIILIKETPTKIRQERVSNKNIDKKIKAQKSGLTWFQFQNLLKTSKKGWFRSYARQSKDNLNKITAKIRRGVIENKFAVSPIKEQEKTRGHKYPEVKKDQLKTGERKKSSERHYTPETKTRVQKASEKFPDASNTELRHGVLNSKVSKAYRLRHYGHEEYTGRIIE